MNSVDMTFYKIIEWFNSQDNILAVALGGSRSRGTTDASTDYDIFVILKDEKYENYLSDLPSLFTANIPELLFFGKDKHLEDWGYMFCGVNTQGAFFDIAFMPVSRIKEMCIRSHNKILFERDGVLTREISQAVDVDYRSPQYYQSKEIESRNIFYINYVRFLINDKKGDYWMSFKFLNLMREALMKCIRITTNRPSKLFFLPEEKFEKETEDSYPPKLFVVDGSFFSLRKTAHLLLQQYESIYSLDETIACIGAVYKNALDEKYPR